MELRHEGSNMQVRGWSERIRPLLKYRWLYIMLLPGILYFVIFRYLPMAGLLIAFKDYRPFIGIWGSEWVGLKHFERLFSDQIFWTLFENTMIISLYNLFFFFPAPIIVAILLNELRLMLFKRVLQTVVYLPHFISWVVVAGLSYLLFTTEGGLVNEGIAGAGFAKVNFLGDPDWIRPMLILQVIWKETGWGTIIFLAAIAGLDSELYEASKMDGANRLRQIWHITLPGIRSVIILLLIIRLGNIMDTGFEQIYLMLNPTNREMAEVFDTYVYEVGIQQGQFSYTAAVGFFKSIVGLILVIAANSLSKRLGEEGIY